MPNKYPHKKGWSVPKQKYKISNWAEYNAALRRRGKIDIWMSDDVLDNWYETYRVYDGTGTPKIFTDFAIITCHEIRQVFKLPLRQCQGFIDSLFQLKKWDLHCPDYSCLSKRLADLHIASPRYKKHASIDDDIVSIAIDSTGLKRFGRGEWHEEKYQLSAKRSWRKLHIAVDTNHIIHACDLTDRFSADCESVSTLAKQVEKKISHVTPDGAYDKNPTYETLTHYFPESDVVIPPSSDAVYSNDSHPQRNRNLQEIKTFGRMAWQRIRHYGRRNYSELAIFRYKKILGGRLHAIELSRQKSEAILGCGILNRMTGLGMPQSYRCA
jgi:hypothetical protein